MIILVDSPLLTQQLLPFTYLRTAGDIRVGALTISEKWQAYAGLEVRSISKNIGDHSVFKQTSEEDLIVTGGLCPNATLLTSMQDLKPGEVLMGTDNNWLALRGPVKDLQDIGVRVTSCKKIEYGDPFTNITRPWHIFQQNGNELREDIYGLLAKEASHHISDKHTVTYRPEHIFIADDVEVKASILDATNGPVFIDTGAVIQPGAIILGPVYVGKKAIVSAGARIKGDTSVGPRCRVGGEVTNSVFFGHSNKGHEGYLGNSVIAEWCNLGADTNCSNLKNNYDYVKVWSYEEGRFIKTGLQFCGLLMGDHSKAGINTMFNTATTVGIGCNIFGAGFPRTFIPSFSWGGALGFSTFQLDKMMDMANRMMERRDLSLTEDMQEQLKRVFKETASYRVWEKNATI